MSKLITLLIIVTILIIVYLGYTCYTSMHKNISDEDLVEVPIKESNPDQTKETTEINNEE